MEICPDVQSEVDLCLTTAKSIGGISISEVLNALEADPDGLKIGNTFNVLKGVCKLKYSRLLEKGDMLISTSPELSRKWEKWKKTKPNPTLVPKSF